MKLSTLTLALVFLSLSACQGGAQDGSDQATGARTGSGTEGWQNSLVGQEGHGGDAIVCFSIPIERALVQVASGQEDTCQPPGPCQGHSSPTPRPGPVWKMTEEGRRSIQSAKPLEQYLGERIASKKAVIDQLNQMSPEDAYRKILQPFSKLPSAANRLSEMHQRLGWLSEDGIASEFGLADINDSGFVNENEIDRAHCKELQAVVRRDNQLWYDSDIVSRFDTAGKVLIQLHEEIYAWGKGLDAINWEIFGPPAHETSTKTRRLILKLLDGNLSTGSLNENLKGLGFSAMHWQNTFKVPVSAGYYMDSETCVREQQFLRENIGRGGYGLNFWLAMQRLFSDRYLVQEHTQPGVQLRFNFPDILSNMIALTFQEQRSPEQYRASIMQLQAAFEQPEACQSR